MDERYKIMTEIQTEKEKDYASQVELDAEGKAMAENKRFTFDVIDTPVDPLR